LSRRAEGNLIQRDGPLLERFVGRVLAKVLKQCAKAGGCLKIASLNCSESVTRELAIISVGVPFGIRATAPDSFVRTRYAVFLHPAIKGHPGNAKLTGRSREIPATGRNRGENIGPIQAVGNFMPGIAHHRNVRSR
jgi:hypothetical protein